MNSDERKKGVFDIKVVIEKDRKEMSEMLELVPVGEYLDEAGCLQLKKLVLALKNQYNFQVQNKEIQFYLAEPDIFMNCGIDPINDDIKIRPENFEDESVITIKARDLGISLVHRLMSFDAGNTLSDDRDQSGADDLVEKSKCRRTKQRKIGHIIDKVIEWRKYYTGGFNGNNEHVKLSLERAAGEVGISKKSLDDYLFQIRFGNKFGFNFNEHYNDKVGVLREFVRQNKKNDKTENKQKKAQRFGKH